MVKPASFDSNGMKKGAWSDEEDERLRAFVHEFGHSNWRLLPVLAGLARCGKSCRLRWVNYLKPGLKRGKFSKQEEELIIKLHRQLGNKWSAIAVKLPGRTDNEIKNYWHAHINKRARPPPHHHPALILQEEQAAVSPSPSSSSVIIDDHHHQEEDLETTLHDILTPTAGFYSSAHQRAILTAAPDFSHPIEDFRDFQLFYQTQNDADSDAGTTSCSTNYNSGGNFCSQSFRDDHIFLELWSQD